MGPAELLEIMKMCRGFHVEQFKLGDLEIKFAPGWSIADPVKPEPAKIGMEHGMPTEDELLFMSAPDGPPEWRAEPPA